MPKKADTRMSVPISENERVLLKRAAEYRGLSASELAKRYIEVSIAEEIVSGVLR